MRIKIVQKQDEKQDNIFLYNLEYYFTIFYNNIFFYKKKN